jgi:hypothetical protein
VFLIRSITPFGKAENRPLSRGACCLRQREVSTRAGRIDPGAQGWWSASERKLDDTCVCTREPTSHHAGSASYALVCPSVQKFNYLGPLHGSLTHVRYDTNCVHARADAKSRPGSGFQGCRRSSIGSTKSNLGSYPGTDFQRRQGMSGSLSRNQSSHKMTPKIGLAAEISTCNTFSLEFRVRSPRPRTGGLIKSYPETLTAESSPVRFAGTETEFERKGEQ